MSALARHLKRIELENAVERWAVVPDGTFAKLYAREHLVKRLFEPGWCRLWVRFDGDEIVGHASLFDIGEGDVVGGHISVELPHRGKRIARWLQDQRLPFCDSHGLTLTGPIAPGNDRSAHGCKRMGFEPVLVDEQGLQWVARSPKGSAVIADSSLVPCPD